MKLFRKKLNNGMTVIGEWRELPVVAVSISNRFGAGSESSENKGIAHLIEHMVFTGTKTRTHEDISREIEKKGGVLNAFTANELTSYWFKLPSVHLFTGLDILADLLEQPLFALGKFEKEQKVILEEIKMYKDDPQHRVYDLLHQALYAKPFGEAVIGNEQSVSGLEKDFVFDYFERHYSPENYIVTLVGNVDFEKVCAYLELKFAKRGRQLPKISPIIQNLQLREERAGIDQAHYMFAVHIPLPGTQLHYAYEVLDGYLANGMSSRLFLHIREEKGLAYAVKSMLVSEKSYAYYGIYVGTTKQAVAEVEQIILEELRKAGEMSLEDLNAAKERMIGLRKLSTEESTQVMQELTFAELAGKAEEYYEHEQRLKSVTLEQVRQAARIKEYASAIVAPET